MVKHLQNLTSLTWTKTIGFGKKKTIEKEVKFRYSLCIPVDVLYFLDAFV